MLVLPSGGIFPDRSIDQPAKEAEESKISKSELIILVVCLTPLFAGGSAALVGYCLAFCSGFLFGIEDTRDNGGDILRELILLVGFLSCLDFFVAVV